MPKIKLKPNLLGVEVGIGNAVKLKLTPGETVEVAEDLLTALLSLGHFEVEDPGAAVAQEAAEHAAGEPEETGDE
jgi:hypothetical protein